MSIRIQLYIEVGSTAIRVHEYLTGHYGKLNIRRSAEDVPPLDQAGSIEQSSDNALPAKTVQARECNVGTRSIAGRIY